VAWHRFGKEFLYGRAMKVKSTGHRTQGVERFITECYLTDRPVGSYTTGNYCPSTTMTTTETIPSLGNADFLFSSRDPKQIFTREDLSRAQQMVGNIAADFMRMEVLPLSDQIYAKDWSLTRELLVKAGELDLLRVDIPEAYGGLGLDKVSSAYVGEQIAIIPSFAGSLGAHTTIGTLPIVYFGNEDQKARYLPRLASGEMIGAYALTEPGSGSDALAALTKATLSPDGKHYLLNGQKMWITNGGFADLFTIFAKVDGQHFTAFLVERDMGVVSGREEPKLGLDGSSTTALILDNVKVPVENVLGTVGQGHKVAFNILNLGRLKLGTRNIGSAKQALTRAVRYAIERHQFGQAIAQFGLIKQKLAEMTVRCYVGDAMVYRTLGDVDGALEGIETLDHNRVLKAIESFAVECSINKVWTSEALATVVDESLQVFGGYGYSQEFPAERAYRDARITRIYEGTNEINRLIITTRLLRGETFSRLLSGEIDVTHKVDSKTPFQSEREQLNQAKRLAGTLLTSAHRQFGESLSTEQELLAHISDIIIEVYAVESAILRTEKIITNCKNDPAIPVEITSVFTSDAMDRIQHSAKQAKSGLAEESSDSLQSPASFNLVAARRRIADAIINAGRYYL
jgi:alkylation response protein AidB-like acyl-CoA dehydrogenase